jgi:hypothetical protein
MPAIPAPTMQTSAWIFLSSAGIDGSFDVADQSDTPSLEMETLCDTDLSTRRREGTWAIAFSPDFQLPATTINDDRAMGRSAASKIQKSPSGHVRHIQSPAITLKT